jgi:putative transposase
MEKRVSEEQIVKFLQEYEQLGSVREVSRNHNICEKTIYRWKQIYGGMEVSEGTKLKALEAENLRLKN